MWNNKRKKSEILEEETIISEEQNGSRINRGTENIYLMNEIIEDAKKKLRNILRFLRYRKGI